MTAWTHATGDEPDVCWACVDDEVNAPDQAMGRHWPEVAGEDDDGPYCVCGHHVVEVDEWVWVPDRAYRSPAIRATSCRRCGDPAVAEVDRHISNPRVKERWWGWCWMHLQPYHRMNGDVVECRVAFGSPAHRRGWTR